MSVLSLCYNVQMDGAKLVSINNREEHTFIVRWLAEHAKQGCVSFCKICEFCLLYYSCSFCIFDMPFVLILLFFFHIVTAAC